MIPFFFQKNRLKRIQIVRQIKQNCANLNGSNFEGHVKKFSSEKQLFNKLIKSLSYIPKMSMPRSKFLFKSFLLFWNNFFFVQLFSFSFQHSIITSFRFLLKTCLQIDRQHFLFTLFTRS